MTKPIQPADQIVKAMIALRDEMAQRGYSEFAFRINSCLYGPYPHKPGSTEWREKYAPESWIKGDQNV